MMSQKSLTENEALSTVVDMLISATETVRIGLYRDNVVACGILIDFEDDRDYL